MFGLLSRPRRKTAPKITRFARPGLERLETRDCPSQLTLSVSYGTGHSVTLTGDLTGTPTPANQYISIQGVAVGEAVTDANGIYCVTLQAQSLGTVTAQTCDGQSNVAEATVSNVAPVITNFKAVAAPGNWWTFSGVVTDEHPGGLVVMFNGSVVDMQGKSCTVNNDGTFSYTIQLNGKTSDNGMVDAEVTDWWGAQSSEALANVSQTGVT